MTVDPVRDDAARTRGPLSLTLLIGPGDDVRDCVLSIDEGGRKLERGFANRIDTRTGGSLVVSVRRSRAGDNEALLDEFRRNPAMLADVDVVLLSVAPEVGADGSAIDAGHRFEVAAGEITALVKQHEARVIVFNASSFDPADTTSCYAGLADTPSLFVQHLNRSLIELSVLDGLSIVDADRIIAEIGGASHVEGLLSYSVHACDLLCEELLRVLDDYGFFDDRPLLAQVGRRER